jgi:hypothetical protein
MLFYRIIVLAPSLAAEYAAAKPEKPPCLKKKHGGFLS